MDIAEWELWANGKLVYNAEKKLILISIKMEKVETEIKVT